MDPSDILDQTLALCELNVGSLGCRSWVLLKISAALRRRPRVGAASECVRPSRPPIEAVTVGVRRHRGRSLIPLANKSGHGVFKHLGCAAIEAATTSENLELGGRPAAWIARGRELGRNWREFCVNGMRGKSYEGYKGILGIFYTIVTSSSSSHRFERTKIKIFADRRAQPIWVSILAVSVAPDALALSVSQTEVVSAILVFGQRASSDFLRDFEPSCLRNSPCAVGTALTPVSGSTQDTALPYLTRIGTRDSLPITLLQNLKFHASYPFSIEWRIRSKTTDLSLMTKGKWISSNLYSSMSIWRSIKPWKATLTESSSLSPPPSTINSLLSSGRLFPNLEQGSIYSTPVCRESNLEMRHLTPVMKKPKGLQIKHNQEKKKYKTHPGIVDKLYYTDWSSNNISCFIDVIQWKILLQKLVSPFDSVSINRKSASERNTIKMFFLSPMFINLIESMDGKADRLHINSRSSPLQVLTSLFKKFSLTLWESFNRFRFRGSNNYLVVLSHLKIWQSPEVPSPRREVREALAFQFSWPDQRCDGERSSYVHFSWPHQIYNGVGLLKSSPRLIKDTTVRVDGESVVGSDNEINRWDFLRVLGTPFACIKWRLGPVCGSKSKTGADDCICSWVHEPRDIREREGRQHSFFGFCLGLNEWSGSLRVVCKDKFFRSELEYIQYEQELITFNAKGYLKLRLVDFGEFISRNLRVYLACELVFFFVSSHKNLRVFFVLASNLFLLYASDHSICILLLSNFKAQRLVVWKVVGGEQGSKLLVGFALSPLIALEQIHARWSLAERRKRLEAETKEEKLASFPRRRRKRWNKLASFSKETRRKIHVRWSLAERRKRLEAETKEEKLASFPRRRRKRWNKLASFSKETRSWSTVNFRVADYLVSLDGSLYLLDSAH
ncbi:hypothetical protein M5K25_006020 [Dendrobium thyrsiflorum]|uniref:Uncharacterized protein n=1 Tax=Dendrobium thyrsiflorum TaxID=117978 RepID=A0ABD0VAI9_DENTH